ncbi:NAD(P)/FAD-dependent oxidoreductase [Kitasatospora paracochleata]|uniref:Glycine/D-amino acid oxidase-like deaminating enzyme n=1 Tax=Kitasatospora paracochleata TaxID=58354 RepID=A0ABT1J182_9ACTN|nr:FAD-dependent oxidoreductase [Kitasatospora paracochleata]MCP2311167.1 glycine/D-amino acid oxidase-like deaminating enzyme [Kitasatospora paracochleata]
MHPTPTSGPAATNGRVSFWYAGAPLPERRPPLPGDLQVDVAIVGAGYTGLWTAYYLKQAQPDLRIAVLEKEFAGFGASGRNGGWLTAALPGQFRRFAAARGEAAAVAMQRAMIDTVDEVARVAAAERIDCDLRKDGELSVATNPVQQRRLLDRLPALRREGWGEEDMVLLDRHDLADRVRIAGADTALWTPHCARIQPAKLVRGLAATVERMGVRIYEGTEVTHIRPGAAVCRQGTVRADQVVRALEGFTARMPGHRRTWVPMNSSLVVTAPLPPDTWREIGWQGAELIGDEAHAYCYLQRTADGRIAIGGRGVPYRYGSRIDTRGETPAVTQVQLRDLLHRLFPATAGTPIDHAWSGVLGVPRDWCATVGLDRSTGLGWAGGYVGHGVTSANLAGRTLRDLILRQDTDLAQLPWVGRRVRRWEPEPLRWLGIRALYTAYRAADRRESAGLGRTSAVARAADLVSGR